MAKRISGPVLATPDQFCHYPAMAPRTAAKVAGLSAPSVPVAEVPEDEAGDIGALLEELAGGDSYAVTVFRRVTQGPDSGKWSYVTKIEAGGFSLDDLQRAHGGGRYLLKVSDTATGRYVKSKVVVIEGSAPVPVPAAPTTTDDTTVLLRELLLEMRSGRTAAPAVAEPTSMLEMVKQFAEVAALMGGGRGDGASAKDMLDMYFRGKEDGQRDVRPGDSGGDMRSALMEIGAPLLAVAQKNLELQRQAPAAPQAPVQGVEVTAGTVPVADGSPAWVRMVRPFAPLLYARARLGKNARVYANTVAEELPDTALAEVSAALQVPDFPQQFLAAFPSFNETAALRQWVHDFVDEARAILLTDEEGEELPVAVDG